MLAPMDLAAASAGPWLVLGVVLGLLIAGMLAFGAASLRRTGRSSTATTTDPDTEPAAEPGERWLQDDLPGFLDRPPGMAPDESATADASYADDPPLAVPETGATRVRRRRPAHSTSSAPAPARVLLVLATVALLLVGVAAALSLVGPLDPSTATTAPPSAPPTWDLPDLTAFPERPEPGDPGAGRLAAASVPLGDEGAFARLTFGGLVLERRAVGVTATYPSLSLTAAQVPVGPALAHVVLPVWNCLTDTAPDDPVAAGCRRLPTEYAELPTPALTVTNDGDGLRIDGRFPTYVRPGGTPPDWTGRVYRLTAHITPDGDDATGSLHLGTERAAAVEDPLLSDFRRGP